MLSNEPTGIANFARNAVARLRIPVDQRLLLSAQPLEGMHHRLPVNATMTPLDGLQGHLRRLYWTQFELPRLYQQQQAELLFSPLPEAPLNTRVRTVVTVHDLIPLRYRRWSPLQSYFRFYVPRVLRNSCHVVCNSRTTADELMQRWGISARKLTPVALGVDHKLFHQRDRSRTRDFLYVGTLFPHKNLPRVLNAFALVAPHHPETSLNIVGTPDHRFLPALQQQVRDQGLDGRVHFLGYVPDPQLPELYARARALIFPSLWEGFGLPVLEAMACGLPVLTSNCAALPEVAGQAALMVNPYQTGSIAAAMDELLRDEQLWCDLQRAGLKRSAQFTWDRTGAELTTVLERFL